MGAYNRVWGPVNQHLCRMAQRSLVKPIYAFACGSLKPQVKAEAGIIRQAGPGNAANNSHPAFASGIQ